MSLAFDAARRAELQRALHAMASAVDVGSATGLHRAAVESARLLAAATASARYASVRSERATESDAERRFFALVHDLKARYRHDVARGDRGPADLRARPEEGEGLVVVSFVVGTTRRLAPLPGAVDPDTLARALTDSVAVTPDELVALEVIWSPALDADRMSSAELEVLYPELGRLDSSADLGRVVCHACDAVYAAELGRCPGCGAVRSG
ncbi:MAG: DUF1517 domain-containing protein [Myxococcales bacterium]|nr:DUF1517 domain-containing protein [Myxococcales bacterium]